MNIAVRIAEDFRKGAPESVRGEARTALTVLTPIAQWLAVARAGACRCVGNRFAAAVKWRLWTDAALLAQARVMRLPTRRVVALPGCKDLSGLVEPVRVGWYARDFPG
jgi:hypothetical protein